MLLEADPQRVSAERKLIDQPPYALDGGGKAKAPVAESAATLKELADAQFYAGHYVFRNFDPPVLDIHRQLYGERHPLVADDLINLGAVQLERGHY